jgi:hypothetical protein
MTFSHVVRCAAALIGLVIGAQSLAAGSEEQLVCRYEARPGSRILAHPCLTATEWVEMDKREAAMKMILGPGAPSQGNPAGATPTVSVNLNR